MEQKPSKLNKDKCAPDKEFKDGSCFSLESLKLIAEKYNQKNIF